MHTPGHHDEHTKCVVYIICRVFGWSHSRTTALLLLVALVQNIMFSAPVQANVGPDVAQWFDDFVKIEYAYVFRAKSVERSQCSPCILDAHVLCKCASRVCRLRAVGQFYHHQTIKAFIIFMRVLACTCIPTPNRSNFGNFMISQYRKRAKFP